MKRDGQVASARERRRCSADEKSRVSSRLRAFARSNRNVGRLALG